MNREALAAECKRLGMPSLTASALTNIESGRKQDNVRRRQITVDELVVLAWALRISVPMLLAPYEHTETSELLPDQCPPTWASARWVAGEDPDSWRHEQSLAQLVGDPDEWMKSGWSLLALRRHERLVADRLTVGGRLVRAKLAESTASGEPSEMRVTEMAGKTEEADEALISWRKWMVEQGLSLPDLPAQLVYLGAA